MIQSLRVLAAPSFAHGSPRTAAIIIGVALLLGLLLAAGGSKRPAPRRLTSADYHRAAVAACALPRHQYTSGSRVNRRTMRYHCSCGAYQDRRLRGGTR